MKVSQLLFDEASGRYILDNDALSCGEALKVLVFNGLTNKAEWIDTRIELDSQDNWYLVGLLGYSIGGLFAARL